MQKQNVLSAGSTIIEYKDYSIHNLFGKPKKNQKNHLRLQKKQKKSRGKHH